ncbi:hypothetical protein ACHWQZ_G003501 [Mnemiopsis leidyi]
MSLFSTGGGSYPDLLILCLLGFFAAISLLLNPPVMLYNYRKKKSIPKLLFFTLSATDFLTCLVLPLNSMIKIGVQEPPKCTAVEGEGYVCSTETNPTTGDRLLGALILTLSVAPSSCTAALAITRFITIRFPFRTLRVRYALAAVCLYLVYSLAVNTVVTLDKYAIYRHSLNMVTNPFYLNRTFSAPSNDIRVLLLCIWPLILCQTLSIIASGFTVVHLFQTSKCSEDTPSLINNKKVSLKILVTNLSGIVLTVAAGISAHIQIDNARDRLPEKRDEVLDISTMVMVPVFLSCLNPIIFILFTPNVLTQCHNRARVDPGGFHETTSYPRSNKTIFKNREAVSSPI